ncbi:hypothetical protein CRG98_021613 [Punica granatum]|uniref:Uncharacterized protein n=1 Tax=Punica granatum TaxID=22663 RepID=A0A2I0JQ54_PUNGR|nr:hypothetical protein CRG98_021613 [Punica granatum]
MVKMVNLAEEGDLFFGEPSWRAEAPSSREELREFFFLPSFPTCGKYIIYSYTAEFRCRYAAAGKPSVSGVTWHGEEGQLSEEGVCVLENQATVLKRQAQEKRLAMTGIVRSRDQFCEALLVKRIIWVCSIRDVKDVEMLANEYDFRGLVRINVQGLKPAVF